MSGYPGIRTPIQLRVLIFACCAALAGLLLLAIYGLVWIFLRTPT